MISEKEKPINISFIIPSYNSSETLEETINSIIKTNFIEGDEIIIVDDCSNEKTIQVSNQILKKYPIINFIKNKKNIGCPATRNVGISSSNNKYILSLDSDNVLSENSIKILRDSAQQTDADIISFSEIHFFNKNIKNITHKWIFKKEWFTLTDLFSGNYNPAPVGNYLFKKSIWEKVNGFDEYGKGLHEAWIFTLKNLVNGAKFYICNSGFYYHRYGHDSLTIREYSKESVEKDILKDVMDKYMFLFNPENQNYIISNTPNWIHELNKKPIELIDCELGINGKLERTYYGIYNSIFKKIKKWI